VEANKKADKKTRKLLKRLELSEVKTVEDLLKHYGIRQTDWDYLIIGDGSGTGWDKEIGWGSTLICKADNSRKVFFGAMSSGTNNTAELYAALHPLTFLVNNMNWADRPEGVKVHVITDSKYVADGLTHDNPIWVASVAKNRELWMAIHMTRRRGIEIVGHHLPRNSIELATFGHTLANASRTRLIGVLTELRNKERSECESKSPPEISNETSEKEPTQKTSASTTDSPQTET
jgi:ribonuclease HI